MLMPLEIGIVPEIAMLLAQQINWFNLQTCKCMDFFKVPLNKIQMDTNKTFAIKLEWYLNFFKFLKTKEAPQILYIVYSGYLGSL